MTSSSEGVRSFAEEEAAIMAASNRFGRTSTSRTPARTSSCVAR